MGSQDIEISGAPKPPSADTPSDCNSCQYTEITRPLSGYFDTVNDAKKYYKISRFLNLDNYWRDLFKEFQCPPKGKDCAGRKSCSRKPTYIHAVATQVVDPKDNQKRWQIQLTIGRELKCVPVADATGITYDYMELPEYPPTKGRPDEESHPPKDGPRPKDKRWL